MSTSYQECPRSKFVLPASFSDALSYYEQICKLVAAYNSLVDFVNTSLGGFVDTSKEYTDQKIAEARVEFDQKAAELQTAYDQFVALTDNNIKVLQDSFKQLETNMEQAIVGVNARTDLAIQQNNEYLLDLIAKDQLNIKVLNYFTGEYVSVQEMFDYLSQFHLQNAITYEQLASRNITYDGLVALNITYTQLATDGSGLIPQN